MTAKAKKERTRTRKQTARGCEYLTGRIVKTLTSFFVISALIGFFNLLDSANNAFV
jgi:hypothetical protein